MKPSPAQLSRRIGSALLLAAFSTLSCLSPVNLAGFAPPPAFAQEAGDPDRAMVHSRSAETRAASSRAGDAGGGQSSGMTLRAGISYTVPKGTSMNLKVTSVPSNGMRLLQKDLEGNPMPARVNDVIFAQITEDIYVDGDRVIPEGSIFRGHVVRINDPRRVQRPGWVDISFNELQLPDGRIFRFRAEADSFQKSTMKTKARAAGMIAANAAGGAIIGTAVAYQLFGMHYTIACKGYNLAAGAALGAVLAGGHAILKKGHRAWLEPGDSLNLSFDTDMVMPALQAPTKHADPKLTNLPGLTIDVLKSKVIKNGIGGHFIRLDVNIDNESDVTLQAIDLYLRDTLGNKCPIVAGPDFGDESAYLFELEPNSSLRSTIYFDVEYPKLPHEIVWYDHEHRGKVCFKKRVQL